MKRFAALVLVFCLLSAAPALAADWRPNAAGTLEWHGEDAAEYTGTYYMSSVMGLGFDQFAALLDEHATEELKNSLTFTLNADGTALITSDGESLPLIWNVTGTDLLMIPQGSTDPDDILRGTISGGIISLDLDGTSATFSRADADTTAYLRQDPAVPAPVNDGIIAGTYKLYSVMGLSAVQYAALMGASVEEARNSIVFLLNADGTGAMAADGELSPFFWTAKDGIVTISDGTDTLSCTWADGILTIDMGGELMSLAKES